MRQVGPLSELWCLVYEMGQAGLLGGLNRFSVTGFILLPWLLASCQPLGLQQPAGAGGTSQMPVACTHPQRWDLGRGRGSAGHPRSSGSSAARRSWLSATPRGEGCGLKRLVLLPCLLGDSGRYSEFLCSLCCLSVQRCTHSCL